MDNNNNKINLPASPEALEQLADLCDQDELENKIDLCKCIINFIIDQSVNADADEVIDYIRSMKTIADTYTKLYKSIYGKTILPF